MDTTNIQTLLEKRNEIAKSFNEKMVELKIASDELNLCLKQFLGVRELFHDKPYTPHLKVKELIELLQGQNPDDSVYVLGKDGGGSIKSIRNDNFWSVILVTDWEYDCGEL